MEKEIKEKWRPVVGYEGFYEVSSLGRVRSLDRIVEYSNGARHLHQGQFLSPTKDKCGYLVVHLYKDGKRTDKKVHRLVAQAFIPNPRNLPEVNHKNEVKNDNRVENLEWISHLDNNNYGTKNERAAKRLSKTVSQIDPTTLEIIKEWPSTAECGRNGFDSGLVSKCCRRKYKTSYGYIWRYKSP